MAGYHGAYRDDLASNIAFNFVFGQQQFYVMGSDALCYMAVLTLNLAAQAPKVIILVMLTSLAVNIIVIAISAVMFLM